MSLDLERWAHDLSRRNPRSELNEGDRCQPFSLVVPLPEEHEFGIIVSVEHMGVISLRLFSI